MVVCILNTFLWSNFHLNHRRILSKKQLQLKLLLVKISFDTAIFVHIIEEG